MGSSATTRMRIPPVSMNRGVKVVFHQIEVVQPSRPHVSMNRGVKVSPVPRADLTNQRVVSMNRRVKVLLLEFSLKSPNIHVSMNRGVKAWSILHPLESGASERFQ